MLAPGEPTDQVQLIDVRDLAAWLLTLIEARTVGVLDAMSEPMTRADFLAAVGQGVGVAPTFTWVDQAFLVEHQVEPWMGPRSIPLWIPLPDYDGFMSRDVSLTMRPVADTARDTLAWLRSDPDHSTTGLPRDEERELLTAWHAHRAAAG